MRFIQEIPGAKRYSCMALNVQLSIANAARTMGRGAAERPAMTSDTHEIEKAGFWFDRLGFPEFTLCPLDRVKVSRNRAQAGAVCASLNAPIQKIVACTDPYTQGWRREASPYPDRNRGERRTGPWMPG